jgi:hypothetical protein
LLRTEASALGSNLSILQIRQDFSKNLINVLQTGSSNLTLADTNEEAANRQALLTPPVDRGARIVAGQPVATERAPTPALSPASKATIKAAGKTRPFLFSGDRAKHRLLPDRRHSW